MKENQAEKTNSFNAKLLLCFNLTFIFKFSVYIIRLRKFIKKVFTTLLKLLFFYKNFAS